MDEFPWYFEDSIYTLKTKYGKAVILEIETAKSRVIGGSRCSFLPRFEPVAGDVIESEMQFDDFEVAESWLIYGQLMSVLRPDELQVTLDYCLDLLR